MIPTPGRIVEYVLADADVEQVRRQRQKRVHGVNTYTGDDMDGADRTGNQPSPGDKYPMVIVRAWGQTETSSVNGQVLLDGNDTLWVTSRQQDLGDGECPPYRWRPFARVENEQ